VSALPAASSFDEHLVRDYARLRRKADAIARRSGLSPDGRWRYLSPSLTGDFYARIAVRVVRSAGHRHVCGSAASRPVRVQPQADESARGRPLLSG